MKKDKKPLAHALLVLTESGSPHHLGKSASEEEPKEKRKAPKELIEAVNALSSAIQNHDICQRVVIRAERIGADDRLPKELHLKSCDVLAMAHVNMVMAITTGKIEEVLTAIGGRFGVSEGKS